MGILLSGLVGSLPYVSPDVQHRGCVLSTVRNYGIITHQLRFPHLLVTIGHVMR